LLLSNAVLPASSVDWTAKKYVVLSFSPVSAIECDIVRVASPVVFPGGVPTPQ